MRYFWSKLTKPIRSILLFALIFGTAFLVLLFYLGYYDFSFLERYKDELDLLREGERVTSAQDDPFAVPDALLMNPAADDGTPSARRPSVTTSGYELEKRPGDAIVLCDKYAVQTVRGIYGFFKIDSR